MVSRDQRYSAPLSNMSGAPLRSRGQFRVTLGKTDPPCRLPDSARFAPIGHIVYGSRFGFITDGFLG